MDYSYDLYRIQPTQGAAYTASNPRTAAPDDVGGTLKVASFNVLNYFTTLNSRGANTPEEFERQRSKIIAAITATDADVVGLIEIENNTEAIQDLVDGLNDVMGAGTYAYVDTGVIGIDEIKVAFIYRPATVSPVGDYAILDSSVDARFIDTKNRPALAQTFQDDTTGGIFTVVVNHLKSKGSDCNDVGDPDTGDGAGNCNLTRKAAAEALVDWLATDPTGSGDEDFLIIGDLNSYDKEDPIDTLLAGGYTDLLYQYMGEYAYTYLFDGQLGYLDHALAGAGLLDQVTGAAVWHINADEPDLIDYDMSYKEDAQDALYAPDAYRSSDHDPVIVGLSLCDDVAPTIEVTVSPDMLWPANHKYVQVTATVVADDNSDDDPTVTLLSVTSNEPDNGLGDGNTVDDIRILSDHTFRLRAERSALGTGRVYTITYQVVDGCGNMTIGSATVRVPLSQSPWKLAIS
jgi:predicted extracellular nuclease